jgi:hypothetical protein
MALMRLCAWLTPKEKIDSTYFDGNCWAIVWQFPSFFDVLDAIPLPLGRLILRFLQ